MSIQSNTKYRPCPFCGCDDVREEGAMVACERCGAAHTASRWNLRSAYGMGAFGKDLEALVESKVVETMALSQHRLALGGVSGSEMGSILRQGYAEILASIGADLFAKMPAAIMEQFLITTITKNHNTRGLLVGLIQSFTASYAVPQTSDIAHEELKRLESLAQAAIAANNDVLERMRAAGLSGSVH